MNTQAGNIPTTLSDVVVEIFLIGLRRAIGARPKKEADTRNIQCVKLTRDHCNLLPIVLNWCNNRVAVMNNYGVNPEYIKKTIRKDARFLTYLSKEIISSGNKKPDHETWLFFDTSVADTDHFELRECDPGSNVANSTLIITRS